MEDDCLVPRFAKDVYYVQYWKAFAVSDITGKKRNNLFNAIIVAIIFQNGVSKNAEPL